MTQPEQPRARGSRGTGRGRGALPCGCTDDIRCRQHWQAMSTAQQVAWRKAHPKGGTA